MTHERTLQATLRVRALSRVEGEGGLRARVRDGRVVEVGLDIYEPPRFFEGFLRGRSYTEPPDITARICGICPVAYQMSSCQAIEDACGVQVPETVWALRRLLYCGEWIESHALHIHLLHAPDFLRYDSAIAMAADHRAEVERGLAIKKAGNDLMTLVGGRAVHPVNVRVGGFHRAPTLAEVREHVEPLHRARDAALEVVQWVAGLEFPDLDQPFEYVALRPATGYPLERGRVVSSGVPGRTDSAGAGFDLDARDYDHVVAEDHVQHSTALHAHLRGRGPGKYAVGPLARYALNADRLSPLAAEAARAAGLGAVCRNPFRSIVVRAVELVYALDEALRIIDGYEPPDPPAVEVRPRAAVGFGVTEAPRGLLLHRYRLASDGTLLDARIVPPTSQNQAAIEDDIRGVVVDGLDLPLAELTHRCEQAVRNWDPCISCATHFLDVRVERE
ncbi:MAG: Ni/Fe hydrogenase subunit alpha [Actinomycetia bacterium]|jgi:coenzyme F420-reducing hydrogenase alpha subunit|nr:Ni/Fe hydrogenase subunit alpha [Actinomycetes bacterium]